MYCDMIILMEASIFSQWTLEAIQNVSSNSNKKIWKKVSRNSIFQSDLNVIERGMKLHSRQS